MEANQSTRISGDLTSTIESVLTNNGHEKKINHNDSTSVGDSTPSSSSDTNMLTSSSNIVQEDPISSTSDSLTNEVEMNLIPTPDTGLITGTEPSESVNELTGDTDFFTSELSMETMPTEEISEDVEDIANDLENLLGGTAHNYSGIYKGNEKLEAISTSGTSDNLVSEVTPINIDIDSNNLITERMDTLEYSSKQDSVHTYTDSSLSDVNKTDKHLESTEIIHKSDPSIVDVEGNINYELKSCEDNVTDNSCESKTSASVEYQNSEKSEDSSDVQLTNKTELETTMELKDTSSEVKLSECNLESANDSSNRCGDIAATNDEYSPQSSTKLESFDDQPTKESTGIAVQNANVTDSKEASNPGTDNSKSEAQSTVEISAAAEDDADVKVTIAQCETQELKNDNAPEKVTMLLHSVHNEIAENAKNILDMEHLENIPTNETTDKANMTHSHAIENIRDSSFQIHIGTEIASNSAEIHQAVEASNEDQGELISSCTIDEIPSNGADSATNLNCDLNQDDISSKNMKTEEITEGCSIQEGTISGCINELKNEEVTSKGTIFAIEKTNADEEEHTISDVPTPEKDNVDELPKEILVSAFIQEPDLTQKEDLVKTECIPADGNEETIENHSKEVIADVKNNDNQDTSSINLCDAGVEASCIQVEQDSSTLAADKSDIDKTQVMSEAENLNSENEKTEDGVVNIDNTVIPMSVDNEGGAEPPLNLIDEGSNSEEVNVDLGNEHMQHTELHDENVLEKEVGELEKDIELEQVPLLDETGIEVIAGNTQMENIEMNDISLLNMLDEKQGSNKEVVNDTLESTSPGDEKNFKEMTSDCAAEVKDFQRDNFECAVECTEEKNELANAPQEELEQSNKTKFAESVEVQSENINICEQQIICENADVASLKPYEDSTSNEADVGQNSSEIRPEENLDSNERKMLDCGKQEVGDVQNESFGQKNNAEDVCKVIKDVTMAEPSNEQNLLKSHQGTEEVGKSLQIECEYVHDGELNQQHEVNCQSNSKCDEIQNSPFALSEEQLSGTTETKEINEENEAISKKLDIHTVEHESHIETPYAEENHENTEYFQATPNIDFDKDTLGVSETVDNSSQDSCVQEDLPCHQTCHDDTKFSLEVQPEETVGNEELNKIAPQNSGLDNDASNLPDDISHIVDYSAELSTANEASELQCAISHIVENEPIDNSETSELDDAISHIVCCPETTECSSLSAPQIVDASEVIDDSESFELQNAISQIIYPPKLGDESKICEVQSDVPQILDVAQLGDDADNTSELQNAITQIIDDPLQDQYKNKEILNLQINHDEQSINKMDSLDGQSDVISSKQTIFGGEILEDNNVFEQVDVQSQDNEEKIQELGETGEKNNTDIEMQAMYTQPVVALMLEDMDDQLKNVIFESKSSDSISNMPNINDVDLDTPKTFESQHMDLILPEETSLLNTEDIISEITPRNQDIVGFTHEDEIKLQQDDIPETQLKITNINELHGNDSKDLNDVIAREIESLLELQSQDLPDDSSTIDNDGGDIEAAKITNEIISQENTYPHCSGIPSDNVIQEAPLQENVFQYSDIHKEVADRLQDGIALIEKENNYISKQEDKIQDSIKLGPEEYCTEEPKSTNVMSTFIEEVSSSVSTAVISSNQSTDSLVTSTDQADVQSAKELDAPLVIEVDPPMALDEKHLLSESEIFEVPTLNYSSKMSENEDLKMTITKHKIESTSRSSDSCLLDDTQSILKIFDPKDSSDSKKIQKVKEVTVPKLIIKPIVRSQASPTTSGRAADEIEHPVPKLFIKNMSPNRPGSPKVSKTQKSEITSPLKLTIKPVLKPEECPSKSSPKLTIKPIIKNEDDSTVSGPKITIKPIVKPPEEEMCHSPKITIKPIVKPDDCQSEAMHSPRITIKPIPKPEDVKEFNVSDVQSPRITIKPVLKPEERDTHLEQDLILKKSDIDGPDRSHSPRITIKPIIKPDEHKSSIKQDLKSKLDETSKSDKKEGSPKITIKPIVKPIESEPDSMELIDFEEQIKQERIVLKINKNSMAKESRKRDSSEEIEKLAKIKLKFSKEGGHAHIISEQSKLKRALEESVDYDQKRQKFECDDLTITPIDADAGKTERVVDVIKDDVKITPIDPNTRAAFDDPLEKIPVFEITPESAVMMKSSVTTVVQQVVAPTPRRRGRPRKVPLIVREEFKDTKEEEVQQEQPEQQQPQPQPAPEETGRPKRSCRGPSVRTTLGIRTRRPRGSGRGRGRGRVARGVGSRGGRQQRVSAAKLKLLKEEAAVAIAEESKSLEPEDGGDVEMKEEPPVVENVTTETSEIVLIEEETRMSADTNTSRAQTPAKQVDNSVPTPGDVEDTQSSVQSTATTESTKARRSVKTEVHQEPEGEVLSADQLTEYYWGGGGPYMLQEQVAQFLGIKSFKRKYPGIQRRMVDMQERDFIRESGLVSEAMCDLGLTAVHSTDILDIMYTDFQQKYEEYCKHQRERQAKDFSNKQKALSLAASQEKNKHDIMQQAVQSAASWNANFNKSRRDERKGCMDLQTFTVHYPKGKFKTGDRNKIGHYPVALVPGQYTDYYKAFSPMELSNLPLNTLLNKPLNIATEEDSPSDGSGSDSDSSSSDSDSSSSDSSEEDCNICSPTSSSQTKKVLAN